MSLTYIDTPNFKGWVCQHGNEVSWCEEAGKCLDDRKGHENLKAEVESLRKERADLRAALGVDDDYDGQTLPEGIRVRDDAGKYRRASRADSGTYNLPEGIIFAKRTAPNFGARSRWSAPFDPVMGIGTIHRTDT
jgi:hypothetical protein